MTVLDVDPAVYYDAGSSCARLAQGFFTAVDSHVRELDSCGNMAGSYDEAEAWALSYDGRAVETVDTIRALAEALHHYGEVLIQLGFNHATADYDAARGLGPEVGEPPVKPPAPSSPGFVCWIPLPSAGGDGGLLDSGLGLVETIGITVPDGDTGRLDGAAQSWRAIASEPALSTLPSELSKLATTFQDITAPETEFIDNDLRTMQGTADDVLSALTELASSCDEHRQALDELRSRLLNELSGLADELLKELAITAALGVAASLVTFGIGAVAATARAASVAARFAQPLRRIIEVWKSAKNLGRGVGRERDLRRRQSELERIKEIGSRNVGAPVTVPLSTTRAQIEKKFKHADDFGVTEPRGNAGFDAFERAVQDHVRDPSTLHIDGTYRGDGAILNYNESTGLVVVQTPSGEFVSGWRLTQMQRSNVLNTGRLGGG
ncbi:colicin D domain-containing protein [Rhodococcoides trifolii]|nr:colicin D domain-containing protein [Rhodococcus trifolii]